MARPLRIEFPGAVYHVTSRGDRGEPIFVDDEDRQALFGVVAQALSRFDAEALSYCLMDNHYHFVLHTRHAQSLIVDAPYQSRKRKATTQPMCRTCRGVSLPGRPVGC